MIRPQHLVAIIIAPNAPMFADCDVAGRAVGEHLIGAIAARAGRGIDALAIGPATSMSEWCRSACSAWVTDVETAARSNGDWLVINGNAWFGDGAIDVVLSAAANAPHGLRAVSPTVSEGLAGAEVLAVYVPREILLTARETGSTTALENLLRRLLSERPMMDPLLVMEVAVDGMLVEDYRDVAKVERRVLAQRAATALQQGVRMRDPDSVHIRGTLTCGSNVTIDIGVIFEGDVSLGDGVRIDAHSIVSRSSIGAGTVIRAFSLVEEATVGAHTLVGPYGRVRPGSIIGDNCQIGNFVEIKNSRVGRGSRINHHSFIGDAELAERVTIGAGTITCNHDGTKTTHTVIDQGAYVGSGCNLVAPVRIGENATIGAGSTITQDVPAATLTLARARQTTIQGWRGPNASRSRE